MSRMLPGDLLVTQALVALDERLPAGFPTMHLKIVGGYALLVRGVRTDRAEATDIDYIGAPLPAAAKDAVREVGLQFGLVPSWLNNDVLLSGADDVDFIELSTGPLTFEPYESGLRHFTVEVADDESLLRMKLVAVDTMLAMYLDSGDKADLVRAKDLSDIRRICEHVSPERMAEVVAEMGKGFYLVEPDKTLQAARLAVAGLTDEEILDALASGEDRDDADDGSDYGTPSRTPRHTSTSPRRGKTTPKSTPGSFAPRPGVETDEPLPPEHGSR